MRNDAKIAGALLTVEEAAREIRQSPATVYRKVSSGAIPAIRLGAGPKAPVRIESCELAAWLAAHRTT